MNRSINFFAVLSAILLLSFQSFSQEVTIEDLAKNPSQYDGELVTVTGLVKQYTPGNAQSTSFYLLQGDYGGIVKVNTADAAPETFKKYKVTGIAYYDAKTITVFISEKQKTLVDKPVIIREETKTTEPTEDESQLDTTTMLIIGLGVVLFILIIVFFTKRKKVDESFAEPALHVDKTSFQEKPGEADASEFSSEENDFKTIKINRSSDPKTLVFIPGTLTITSGADSGKSFRITGFPTPNGSIVTIGRDKPTDERQYSHIQLMEQTVSRKQAEIISKNGKLQVKNLSETNRTVVDGVELAPGQLADLQPNSTMRTGEVEFKYTV